MIFQIPEFRQHVWISAFNARPQSIEELFRSSAERYPDVSVQLVDMDKVPGRRYLTLAAVNAVKSFHSKQPIAKTLGMELLVYVSGEKQIDRALKRVGVTTRTCRVAALSVGGSSDQVSGTAKFLAELLGQGSNDQLLDDWPETRIENVRSGFDIGEMELKAAKGRTEPVTSAIERLATERSAMLAARK